MNLMNRDRLNDRVNELFRRDQWNEARKLLTQALAKDPENHWLLTQLGVTLYEQRRYKRALQIFQRSRRILADCPLTLWNLAGALDALGKSAEAARIFTWLLQSKITPEEDPCWESTEWTQALKTDCLYRLGVCYQHLGKKQKAERSFREYVELLLLGIDGSYSLDDVMGRLRALHGPVKANEVNRKLKKLVHPGVHAQPSVNRNTK
jgi:tetratricopeptide (TPR) repeat protein